MINDKKVLVTGGAGYIGSHICRKLHQEGFIPIVYDNLSRGNHWAVKWGPLIEGDIRDANLLKSVYDKHRPIATMHLANYAYVQESVQDPKLYFDNNVTGSEVLIETLLKFDDIHLVNSSSCAVYGVPKVLPITEATPCNPCNPYGKYKYEFEKKLSSHNLNREINSISFRYFNAVGSNPENEIGESHSPETHIIPRAIDSAVRGTDFHIYGTDYQTDDGTAVRDYVHVEDIATAHILGMNFLLKNKGIFTFNLGNEVGISVKKIINIVEKQLGKKISLIEMPRRAGDPPALIASANHAREILLWEPKYPNIESSINHAINWYYHQNPGLKGF